MAQNENEQPDFIEVQKYLKGVDYPARKPELVKHAQKQGAPEHVIAMLQGLPDKEYTKPTEITEAVT